MPGKGVLPWRSGPRKAREEKAQVFTGRRGRSYAEGTVAVNRQWPVDVQQVQAETAIARLGRLIEQLDAFMARAARGGVIRPGLPQEVTQVTGKG